MLMLLSGARPTSCRTPNIAMSQFVTFSVNAFALEGAGSQNGASLWPAQYALMSCSMLRKLSWLMWPRKSRSPVQGTPVADAEAGESVAYPARELSVMLTKGVRKSPAPRHFSFDNRFVAPPRGAQWPPFLTARKPGLSVTVSLGTSAECRKSMTRTKVLAFGSEAND